jgi:photosystem II stability/assembly factor-like uncharacterized protein
MCPPLCVPIPTAGTPDFRYLSGGDGVAIQLWPNPSNPAEVRVWVVEDGGRLRYSADGGTNWIYQTTPDLAAQKLLDIGILADGQTAWACGLGGRLIHTTDHGTTWAFANPTSTTLLDGAGRPAVLWSVRFLDKLAGFLAGKEFLKRTLDGGLSWSPIELYRDATLSADGRLDPTQTQFEFYVVRAFGTPTKWVGLAAAQWTRPQSGGPGEISTGALFRGESDVASGTKWWKILEDPVMQEPWDIEFEDPRSGFLVGGHGSVDGKIFHTADGGKKWREERPSANGPYLALYGVAAQGGGNAIACGYGGQIWLRDPASSPRTWSLHPVPGFTAPLTDVAAIAGTQTAYGVGSTGFVRRTTDSGGSWQRINKPELQFRGKDIQFTSRTEGVIVGQRAPGEQHGLVFRTTDGGCSFDTVYPGPTDADPGISQLLSVAFASGTQGMAVGDDGGAVFTRSAGLTWTPKRNGIPATAVLADVAVRAGPAGAEYWAVGYDAQPGSPRTALVLKTTDNGATWQAVAAPPRVSGVTLAGIAFASASEAFVVGSQGGGPIAFRLTQPDAPVWSDVSPAMDATLPRGLLGVCCGTVSGAPATFAVGQTGVLLQWNGASFVGIPDIYEFDPSTGEILVNRYHQNFTVAAIAPGAERLYVGRDTTPDPAISQESGFVLLFDDLGWRDVRVQTNKDLRGFAFVVEGPSVTAIVLGNTSGENAVLDDGLFSDTVVLLHEVQTA